jgi:hypothetical protein
MTDFFDPAELEKLRISQDFSGLSQVKPVLTNIGCHKPKKHDFIRVRPGEEFRFQAACFTDEHTGETYLVAPDVRDHFAGDAKPTLLVCCVSRNSPVPFLWPLKLPGVDGRPNRWHESGIEVAKIAESQWTKVVADMSAGCYVPNVAVSQLPEPDWSETPSIKELIKLCFQNRLIAKTDHPVLRRLRGES